MINRETARRVDAFLEKNLSQYIEATAELCAVPSVSARGEGIKACADRVSRLLEERGFDVSWPDTPGNPIVLGKMEGNSDRTLLFYNHYDVQPPEPVELWSSPPFEPAVRDGRLYARGSRDDKGEFVSRLAAIDAVRSAHSGELPCGVTFVVEGEEEVGSPHIAEFVRQHKDLLRCHGSIWEEGGIDHQGRAMLELGVRGLLFVELSVETMKHDAHSGEAHILPSAAWRLQRVLTSLKDSDERIRIPGFYDRVRQPSQRELELIDSLPPIDRIMRKQFGVKTFVRDLTGKGLQRAVFEPTCNIAGLNSGYQGEGMKTIVPAKATAKLDFRLVPDQDPEDIFRKLLAHLHEQGFEDVVVKQVATMEPAMTDPDDPFVKLAAEAGRMVYGQPSVITPLRGVSSPIYAFSKPLGIPVVRAGVGYWDNHSHAPDEHIRLVDFHNAARHIARILEGFAGI